MILSMVNCKSIALVLTDIFYLFERYTHRGRLKPFISDTKQFCCLETHVRLTGHNSTFAGRVEVFSHGVWGRVTQSYPYWSKNEAEVVCRQLGFPESITALRYSAFGEGSGPVVMSGVQCLGTERLLQQCSYRDWFNSDLAAGYEVGVICKNFNLQPVNNGKQFLQERM